jgi:uncharacterized protein YqgC (DUF456 family)
MTPEELVIGTQLLNQTQMILGQGWDVLVYGTIVSNSLCFLSVLISIVVFIAVTKRLYNSDECDNIEDAAFIGFLVGCFVLLMLVVLTTMALGIICPEYTIMKNVLSSLSPN